MIKKTELLQANGYTNGGGLHGKPKQDRLEHLKALEKELQAQIKLEKASNRPKKQSIKKDDIKEDKKFSIKDKLHEAHFNLVIKERNGLKLKKKSLEQQVSSREKTIKEQNEKLEKLTHVLQDHKTQLERAFDSSKILQLVNPTFQKNKNPFRFAQNYYVYLKKKKEYENLVRIVNKKQFRFIDALEGSRTKFIADQTKKYKINDLEVHKKALQIGEKWLRLYYLDEVPVECSELVYFKLLASPIPFHLSVFVQPSPNAEVLKQARRRISALEAVQTQRMNKGLIRNTEVDKNIEQTTQLAEDITYERERALKYAFYCALEARSEEELNQLEKEFINETEGMELVFNTYSYGQEKAFRTLFPYDVDTVREDKVIQSSGAAILMPFVTKPLYDPKGIFLGTNVYHNSVVFLNPFTPRNNNINIFGVSGAGKSVTSKILASRMFMMGTQIIIVDPEGEYVKLANELGGEVIQFSRENGINPFFVYGKTEDETLSHISTLKTFFKFFIPQEVYNSAELDEVLITLYKKREKQNFNELLKLLKKSPMREYLKVLYEGSMQGIFTSERKLNLDNEFIVFDLSELKKDEKRAPAMYLLTSLLWSLVNNTTDRKRMLFIDEAHMLLLDREVAEFYRLLVKVARKRDLGVVSITQDVEDFLENELGKAIITNSETKILLKQSYATLGLMDKIYPMTAEEKKNLGNMRKGEVVIFREDEHIGAYIQVLPSERELVLTQEAENSHEDQ